MERMLIMDNNLFSIGLYEKALPAILHWKEKLKITKELGFSYFEMIIDKSDEKISFLNIIATERIPLIQWVRDTHLPTGSICLVNDYAASKGVLLGFETGNYDFDRVLLKSFQLHIHHFVCKLWYQNEVDWMVVLQRNRDEMFARIKWNWNFMKGGAIDELLPCN